MGLAQKEWLTAKAAIPEIRLECAEDHPWRGISVEAFLALIQRGDEVWRFSSPRFPAAMWEYDGFAVVRRGEIIETILTNLCHYRL